MKKNIKYGVVVLVAQFLPLVALAAIGDSGIRLSIQTILDFVRQLANWGAIIIGVVGILALLYAAYLYMTAGGEDEKVGKAKKTLIYALIGIAVAILAFSAVPIIERFLKNPTSGY